MGVVKFELWVFEVVLTTADPAVIEHIRQMLVPLGETRLMDDAAHQQRTTADSRLKAAKDDQRAGLAPAKDVVALARELVALRGAGGPARKSNMAKVFSPKVI